MSYFDNNSPAFLNNPEQTKIHLSNLTKKAILELCEGLEKNHNIMFPINKKDRKEKIISAMVDYLAQGDFPFKNIF